MTSEDKLTSKAKVRTMQKSSTLQDSESGERKYSILAPKNPPTPLAVQGVLGAGQAGIIVSQSSHRNQFIALRGGLFLLFRGKTSYASRAMGESVLEVHLWTISARAQTSQKLTPTMLKSPPDQQALLDVHFWTNSARTQTSQKNGHPRC